MEEKPAMYKIEIVKLFPNSNYSKEREEYESARRYNQYREEPKAFIQEKSLSCELSEKEFIEVKKAVLGVM